MVEVGDKAPSFSALADNGKRVSLQDFAGKRVVLYFFPRADSSG